MTLILSDTQVAKTDWVWDFIFTDEDTGDAIDFTGATIEIDIQDLDGCIRISSTTDNGNITLPAIGTIELAIPAAQTDLCAGSYKIGGFYILNGSTLPLLIGTLSVERL